MSDSVLVAPLPAVRGPVREVRNIINDSGDPGYVNRILVGTACTGLVRVEWMMARYGQIIPANWSMVQMLQFMSSYIPLRYQVADAQNLIVAEAIKNDYEWLFLLEHDTIIPSDAFIRINEYMRNATIPIVSGLYFTRSIPSEPLVYRGRGNSYYGDWKMGDLVWADGVPTGALLIHMGVIREMWKDAEPYTLGTQVARRIFDTPRSAWFNEATGQYNTTSGTSDLDWCTRVMKGDYLRKAGWTAFADAHPDFPFLVDTGLFCLHINADGTKFPPELSQWQR
jgi:hypothetical protein